MSSREGAPSLRASAAAGPAPDPLAELPEELLELELVLVLVLVPLELLVLLVLLVLLEVPELPDPPELLDPLALLPAAPPVDDPLVSLEAVTPATPLPVRSDTGVVPPHATRERDSRPEKSGPMAGPEAKRFVILLDLQQEYRRYARARCMRQCVATLRLNAQRAQIGICVTDPRARGAPLRLRRTPAPRAH